MAMRLITTADDFGTSSAVNEAVAEAHHARMLTSASLMVTGNAAHDAIALVREMPGLSVGLHLTLSCGLSRLPAHLIPHLVDQASNFPSSDVRAALRYYFNRQARRELRDEIEAQFETFAHFGLNLSHVDGHQHLHAHPAVLPIVIEFAEAYGATGIRLPQEDLLRNLRVDRSRLCYKAIVALGHAILARACRRKLKNSHLVYCNCTIGSMMSGRMSEDYVIGILSNLSANSVEVFFHPSKKDSGNPFGPNTIDLKTLLSPRLKEFICSESIFLATYADLQRDSEDASGPS
jgi:hopanoid biosynthesis associated protein HpnK